MVACPAHPDGESGGWNRAANSEVCKILGKTEPAVKRRVAYAISTVAMQKVVKKPGARYGATLTGRQKEAAENLASALRRLLNALPDKTIPNRKSTT